MSELALCIHGHFYQPPREDPFTGDIPADPWAEPFPNFNEKVHMECYRPNVELGNLELISFSLGPTLARWLSSRFPTTHDRIVQSDRYHRRAFGSGNSLAQAYDHTILPLASHRDKITQMAWGIADFQRRFGHAPDGMWLPEMAVDRDTLVAMEGQGIRYTILCAHQVRHPNGDWVQCDRPYYVRLPNNRRIVVFLRSKELSDHIAFDHALTQDAHRFAQWCRSTVQAERGLYVIATSGETFGHHLQNRQFFLQSFLRSEADRAGFRIVTPSSYLSDHQPMQEVVLLENTTWSCDHGVTRWHIGCPCTPGDQGWKARLRGALDRLSGGVNALYQIECQGWIDRPWALRDSYISVILGSTDCERLLRQFASKAMPTPVVIRLSRLLEAQRHCQAMYASCAWFFEDLNRIETRHNIGHASLAVEQVRLATGVDLAADVRNDLSTVRSWITDETGRDIYDQITAQKRI